MVNIALLVAFAALLALGQVLFKLSAMAIAGLKLPAALVALLSLPAFYAALALYGASTFLWVWILTRVELSLAYPFVALAMILVPLMASYMFGESLSLAYWIGAGLIVAGMLTMQVSA